jgi:hypothetical protein
LIFPDTKCRPQPTPGRAHGWQSAEGPGGIVVLMRPEQLISAGFAITALAAASVPAVGWTLLGSVEPPPFVDPQVAYVTPSLHPASAGIDTPVAIEREQRDAET